MSRVKKTIITESMGIEDAEKVFAEYATADAQEKKILSEMDVAITKIREKQQDRLTSLKETKDNLFDKLQHFAQTNPDLFAKKRSIELVHGIVGFRTGTPKLKTKKGYTWAAVLTLLKEYLPAYVRTTEEPAKDKLLADREQEEIATSLDKVGIEVTQDESFYVEPKKELVNV